MTIISQARAERSWGESRDKAQLPRTAWEKRHIQSPKTPNPGHSSSAGNSPEIPKLPWNTSCHPSRAHLIPRWGEAPRLCPEPTWEPPPSSRPSLALWGSPQFSSSPFSFFLHWIQGFETNKPRSCRTPWETVNQRVPGVPRAPGLSLDVPEGSRTAAPRGASFHPQIP